MPMRVTDSEQEISSSIDFVANFWGKSPEHSYQIISIRIKDSINTLNELISFYSDKLSIEKEYIRKLEKLQAKDNLGLINEIGSVKTSFDKLKVENQQMISFNNKFVKSITHQNLDKLTYFLETYQKRVSKLQHHMEKILIKRSQHLKELNFYKLKYKEENQSIKNLNLSIKTTWGKELEKNQFKLNKLLQSVNQTKNNYQMHLQTFKQINHIYKTDWSISLNDFYKLEVERIQLLKVNCFNYCNHIATLCVDLDQSVDNARSVFAQVQPQLDVQQFADHYGTGNRVYNDPEFIDYMNGEDDSEETEKFQLSTMKNPDYIPILSRTYSTYSNKTPPSDFSQQNYSPTKQQTYDEFQTQIKQQEPPKFTVPSSSSPMKNVSPKKKPPVDLVSQSTMDDIFSKDERLSKGSTSSYGSERTWNSPRRKEKELNQMQNEITRRATNEFKNKPHLKPESNNEKVPIMKDFSIDFIAKALEDLNQGGNGDVNQFRRSLRNGRPKSDFINDSGEVPTRYDSINFNRPKSMIDVVKRVTPNGRKYLNKAIARYSFKPQHEGELFFRKNWQMYIIHKQEDNWFVCELGDNCDRFSGKIGLIPGNYIIEGDDELF